MEIVYESPEVCRQDEYRSAIAPKCREVAEFIGTMNFIERTLAAAGEGVAQVDAGPLGVFEVAQEAALPRLGSRVMIAIRPEKVTITREPAGGVVNTLAGHISASAYLGDRNHFLVKVEGLEKPFAVALQNSAHTLSDTHRDEANVWLSWAASAGVLLTE